MAEGGTTINVQPTDVAAFGTFLQECAREGAEGAPGVQSVISTLESVRINPGDPKVIPQTYDLLATFGSVVKTFAEALQGFAKGLDQTGRELVKAAGEYANAEELAQADVEDLGALLAASDQFMKESGGRLANLADLTASVENGADPAGDGKTPAGHANPARGEVHTMEQPPAKSGNRYEY